MKSALVAAIVAAVVAAGSAGAALTQHSVHVIRVVGTPVSIHAGSTGFAWASCPVQMKVAGGGIQEDPFTQTPIRTMASYPLNKNLDTWETVVDNPNPVPVSVQTVAVCVG